MLAEVPRDHNRMTVALLNEKWHTEGDQDAGMPEPREL